jgi:hypothetical protein
MDARLPFRLMRGSWCAPSLLVSWEKTEQVPVLWCEPIVIRASAASSSRQAQKLFGSVRSGLFRLPC